MDEVDISILEAINTKARGRQDFINPSFLMDELNMNETDLGDRLDQLERLNYIEMSRGSGGPGVVRGIQNVMLISKGREYLKKKGKR